jgi:hypothetical protein
MTPTDTPLKHKKNAVDCIFVFQRIVFLNTKDVFVAVGE